MPTWKRILIHHSASPDKSSYLDFDQIRRYHIEHNGWSDIGYHFIVESVGESIRVIAARPLYLSGAHCPGQNSTAIGICFVGNYTTAPPSDAMLKEGARFIAGLCHVLRIDPTEIKPHREYRSTECPGDKFPMSELVSRVRLHLP